MDNDSLCLAPPWVVYARKVAVLFDDDPAVAVGLDELTHKLTLYVQGTAKAAAIETLLPSSVEFGNVTMQVEVIPDNGGEAETTQLVRDAFAGNPSVVDVQTAPVGTPLAGACFVEFVPRIVQYPTDDVSDLHGIRTTVMEQVAREVFELPDAYFCTDLIVG